jgi:hypothetical protein
MTKSKVWLHFEINKFDSKLAKCNLCSPTAEEIKRGNGTSNLWSHLELYHKDSFNKKIGKLEQQSQLILIQDKKTDKTSQDSIQNKATTLFTSNKPTSKSKIDQLLAEMIIIDTQPYSIVEDNGFLALMNAAFPHYQVPCRNYFFSYIEKLFNEKIKVLTEKLKETEHVALTTDLWTSSQNEAIVTLTGHFVNKNGDLEDCVLETKSFGSARHTGENISIQLNSITDKFGITEKVLAVSHDNAANMVLAVEKSEFDSIRCAAHTLQLSINDALADVKIQNLFFKCKQLVGHLKHSTLSLNRFKKLQQQNDLKQHKLIQEMCIRWNTSFYMIERIHEQKLAIQQFFQ